MGFYYFTIKLHTTLRLYWFHVANLAENFCGLDSIKTKRGAHNFCIRKIYGYFLRCVSYNFLDKPTFYCRLSVNDFKTPHSTKMDGCSEKILNICNEFGVICLKKWKMSIIFETCDRDEGYLFPFFIKSINLKCI